MTISNELGNIDMVNLTNSQWNTQLHTTVYVTPYLLVTTIGCLALAKIVKFHWNRRKLYRAAAAVKGPPTLPIIGNALHFKGNTTTILQNMLNIMREYPYGLIRVWLGTKLLFVASEPEYIEIILNSPHCLGKDPMYERTNDFAGEGLLSAPVAKWKKNRKVINPAFNQKMLNSFVEIFNEQTKIFLKNLQSISGMKDVNIYHLTSTLSIDSFYESAMGVKVDNQIRSGGIHEWIEQVMMIIFRRMVEIWYHYDFIFNMTKMAKTYTDAKKHIHQFTQKIVIEKRKRFEEKMEKLSKGEDINEEEMQEKKNFLNILLELTHKGSKMTDVELRNEVDTFTVAGTETTASTVSFCFIMLGMHPELQEQIREEVIDVIGEDRDITPEDISRLNLLERFIKETLRIFPVAPFSARVTDKDINLGPYHIPAGCSIAIATIKVHRDPEIWKDPLKFDPNRFLPEEVAKRHPYSYIPFSGGPRNCIGYKYAMMNMKTTLALTLRKFIVKTEYKTIEEIRLMINMVLKPTDGFKVYVEWRE